MSLMIIEMMDLLISDVQAILDELEQENKARELINILLKAARLIQNELKLYIFADGSVGELSKEFDSYTRTPFAVFETGVYLSKRLILSGTITLSADQLARLEQMRAKIAYVKEQLDEIWDTR